MTATQKYIVDARNQVVPALLLFEGTQLTVVQIKQPSGELEEIALKNGDVFDDELAAYKVANDRLRTPKPVCSDVWGGVSVLSPPAPPSSYGGVGFWGYPEKLR